jgi:low affinity Fe/Cu permease
MARRLCFGGSERGQPTTYDERPPTNDHRLRLASFLLEDFMPHRKKGAIGQRFEQLSTKVTEWTGSTAAFGLASATIVIWGATGPLFHFSNTWQLVINTGTTIVTFLMVFLIQRSQNKDSLAIQLKLNELVAAVEGSSNRLIDVEDLSEHELRLLHKYYARLAAMAKKDAEIGESHSIEEAEHRGLAKSTLRKKRE